MPDGQFDGVTINNDNALTALLNATKEDLDVTALLNKDGYTALTYAT